MEFGFESAAITLAIGAVLSVVVQGRLIDDTSAARLPERVTFALRLVDIWLAAVFLGIVIVVIGASLDALTRHAPLKIGDRRIIEHLLAVAAIYPAVIALGRRTLPILYAQQDADYLPARVNTSVLYVVLVIPAIAATLLSRLIDLRISLGFDWLMIGLLGPVSVVPPLAGPVISRRRSLRTLSKARTTAARFGLVEQPLRVTIPIVGAETDVRAFLGSIDGSPWTWWLDRSEARRLLILLSAVMSAHRSTASNTLDRWIIRGIRRPRLTRVPAGARRIIWQQELATGGFFEANELLVELDARLARD